ncbi:CAP domain-containing protein [Streptomyces sp. NPDC054933]
MNDDSTTQFPRAQYLQDGPWHAPATEEDASDPAPGDRGHRRVPRHRGVGSGRRRAAVISAVAALVVVGVVGCTLMTSTGSGGGDAARVPTAAGDVPLAPSTPASASAAASASATATPSASASAGGTASRAGSPSAAAGDRKGASSAPASIATTATADPQPGGGADVPAASPATGTAAQFAQQVADLTNVERAKAGCGPLTVNAKAQSAAQAHSDDMVGRHYFDHADPEGHHADFRLRAAGYDPGSWGENIAYGQPDPAAVVKEWMNSPPHRENILNCDFTVIGVGVNFGADGPWWTQVFASPA